MSEKKIIDMTCGIKTIWFNKNHPAAVYCDKRREDFDLYFGKARTSLHTCHVDPDVLCDFTALPFPDNTFSLAVFDPPHLIKARETAWLVKKYGNLTRRGHKCSETDLPRACAFSNPTAC